jgi:hypothetical protein
MKYTWWEQMQIEKFADMTPDEAIKFGKAEMSKRSKGNKGNTNPWLKGNPEAAKAIRNGTYKKEG